MSRRGEQNKKKKAAAAASSTRIDDWMEHRGVVACYGGGSWYQWSSSGRKPSVDIVRLLLKRTSRRTRQTAKTLLLLLLLSPPSLRTSNCFIHSSAPDDCTRDVIIVEHGTHARHQKEIKTSCAVFMLIISFRCSLNPNANSFFFFFIQQLPCWEVGWWYGAEMMELLQFSSSSPWTVLFRRIVAIAASFLFLSPTLLSCVKTP